MDVTIERHPQADGTILSIVRLPEQFYGGERLITITSSVESIAQAELDELLRLQKESWPPILYVPDFLGPFSDPTWERGKRSFYYTVVETQ